MEQRIEFALKALQALNLRELCREYGISAKTGYKWRQRLLEYGLVGMQELSRRPHEHPQELGEAVVCEMVRLKLGNLNLNSVTFKPTCVTHVLNQKCDRCPDCAKKPGVYPRPVTYA